MAIAPYILEYCLSIAPHLWREKPRSILELGEAQTYQIDLADYLRRISAQCGCSIETISAELEECRRGDPPGVPFNEARLLYRWLFGCADYAAVDLGSRNPDFRIDLNHSFDLQRCFDMVINNGTSEHVFDQANVYRMIHQHTAVDGYMLHYTPGLGWIDHGFYNIQPSFFFDLAKYNRYDVISCALVAEHATVEFNNRSLDLAAIAADTKFKDALLCACLRRRTNDPFCVPMQSPYQ